ncbi:hypothetical protein [Rossellomorea marisflavi]|uniref:hypothetical protein n=1 Tax=Rossellomorea marisflavi TaxID=189381 RepID=UPI003FA12C71
MSNNWKYTMQKHKGKLWVTGSVLTTALIGGGVWLAVSDNSPFSPDEAGVTYLASHVMTSDTVGKVNLLSLDSGDTLDTKVLPSGKNYIFESARNYEQFYAYDGENLYQLKENGDKLVSKLVAENLPIISKATHFSYDGKTLGVYSSESKSVSMIDVQEKKVVSEKKETLPVVQVAVHSDSVYYITSSDMVKMSGKKVERVELGDSLISLHVDNTNMIVQSSFGNEKDENVLFSINPKSLDIESLQKTGASNTTMLSKDDKEEYYMAGKYVEGNDPYYLLDRYKVEAEGLKKDSLTIKVPTGEQSVLMDASNSVLDHDYIYTQADSKLKVFDVKSQSYSHELSVSVDFAMPVLNEGGK